MSCGIDTQDDSPAKAKLQEKQAKFAIVQSASVKVWYLVAYVHLKESHLDGKEN